MQRIHPMGSQKKLQLSKGRTQESLQEAEQARTRADNAKRLMTLTESTKKLGMKKTPTPLERSKTTSVRELQATMEAAQEQLRPFCRVSTPASYPGCSWVYVLHVCVRPLVERFAPSRWDGFYVELARLGGPSGVLTLLTIARIDSDGTGTIDETELKAFDTVATKLILDTCDALQTCALGASLLFGTCFQSIIGRPTFMEGSPASIEAFGEDGVEIMLWLSYSTMTLISVLCLSVIAYALQSRMELQNVLPSTQARLFFLCEVNPMNLVTALFTNALLLFVVLIVIGGLLASPTRGFFTVIAAPMFMFLGNPLWNGMRNGPIRLRLEARAFLGLEKLNADLVKYKTRPGSKASRLKQYLAAYNSATVKSRGPPPAMVRVLEETLRSHISAQQSAPHEAAAAPSSPSLQPEEQSGVPSTVE